MRLPSAQAVCVQLHVIVNSVVSTVMPVMPSQRVEILFSVMELSTAILCIGVVPTKSIVRDAVPHARPQGVFGGTAVLADQHPPSLRVGTGVLYLKAELKPPLDSRYSEYGVIWWV